MLQSLTVLRYVRYSIEPSFFGGSGNGWLIQTFGNLCQIIGVLPISVQLRQVVAFALFGRADRVIIVVGHLGCPRVLGNRSF